MSQSGRLCTSWFRPGLKDINYDVSNEELLMLSMFTQIRVHQQSCNQTAIYDVLSKANNKSISEYINLNSEKKINIILFYMIIVQLIQKMQRF